MITWLATLLYSIGYSLLFMGMSSDYDLGLAPLPFLVGGIVACFLNPEGKRN